MRLSKARVQNFRSIRDSGWFDLERDKTILVGSNEAGKTALLQALQRINPPPGVPGFDPLRDFPRAAYHEIASGALDPAKLTVVEAHFALEEDDRAVAPDGFKNCVYVFGRRMDNSFGHRLAGGKKVATYGDLKEDMARIAAHADARMPENSGPDAKPGLRLAAFARDWNEASSIDGERAKALAGWLHLVRPHVDTADEQATKCLARLGAAVDSAEQRRALLGALYKRLPVFVFFDNYFKVRPSVHLEHLAQRAEQDLLDDQQYDYGNLCLLKMLGFSAEELSEFGRAPEPEAGDAASLKQYRDQLDKRSYRLNAASVQLSNEIRAVWRPKAGRAEAERLKVTADGQYLKVVVEDELGVEIELDQRSEGFQWLVSFFVVFFAESAGKHANAVLLLDEPGLALHGLKQREFRDTLSRLAEANQMLFTTHSPFMVGPDELSRVRIVELTDRAEGTRVLEVGAAEDSAGLFPLQETLSFELARGLFTQERNVILENLTDYWYLEAVAQLLHESGEVVFDEPVSFIPAGGAAKAVYFASIINAHGSKVAALLGPGAQGAQAAAQDALARRFGAGAFLRVSDVYAGPVAGPELEDLLRDTLLQVARIHLGWDAFTLAGEQPARPICDIFAEMFVDFSKYRLAKAFLRWTRNHQAANLTIGELQQWSALIAALNKALK